MCRNGGDTMDSRMRGTRARQVALATAVTLGGVLVMGGAGTAEAATFRIRSCPYTINTPGTYVLATDLICPGLGRAVTVAANNVRLLLGSHTLDGQNLGDAGIFAEGVTGLSVE